MPPTHVFVLIVKSRRGGSCPRDKTSVIGVFANKDNAVARITSLETQMGDTFEFYYLNRKDEINIVADNRHNPPDTGVLLALEYDGCREYVDEVHIEKVPYFVEVNDLVSL